MFVFPLQLDGDYQIRNSPLGGMLPAIEHVVAAFARNAVADARLLVKLHPLDDGLVDWGRIVRRTAVQFGVAGRVMVIDGGAIDAVLRHARAVVTINSTVGMTALAHGVPTIALGNAIYDLPGLTYQGGLDDFWQASTPPDARLYDAFRRVLAARCLIPGGFFSEAGLRLAVDAGLTRLDAVEARSRRAGVAERAPLVETELAELSP